MSSSKTRALSITLPIDLVERLDELGKGIEDYSRSRLIRQAVKQYLKRLEVKNDVHTES